MELTITNQKIHDLYDMKIKTNSNELINELMLQEVKKNQEKAYQKVRALEMFDNKYYYLKR